MFEIPSYILLLLLLLLLPSMDFDVCDFHPYATAITAMITHAKLTIMPETILICTAPLNLLDVWLLLASLRTMFLDSVMLSLPRAQHWSELGFSVKDIVSVLLVMRPLFCPALVSVAILQFSVPVQLMREPLRVHQISAAGLALSVSQDTLLIWPSTNTSLSLLVRFSGGTEKEQREVFKV